MPGEAMTGDELLERVRPVEHVLDNGLRVLVRSDPASRVAAIVTHVRAGYFDEPDSLVGVSHVLEHMFFKGTERRGVGEIARATKDAGGYLNAGTIYDRTSYYTVLPASALDLGLDIQADALMHSTIDEEELRKELLVIIEETRRKRDNPSAMVTEKLYEAMFDAHPMRRWRMGTEESLARLTRADVVEYYRRMYRAPNILLVVSGDVDPDRVIDRVHALYGGVPSGGDARIERAEPLRSGPRLREMTGDIGHTYAELGWRTPPALDPDTPALDALAMVLGHGRASRLYRHVRERGLASSVDAYNYTPTEIGVFGVGIECEPARTLDALQAAWAELERVRQETVTADELARVRTLLGARLLRRLETAEGRANLLAEWHALGDWRLAGAYLDRIRALDPAGLRAVAAHHLDPDRVTLFAYHPEGQPLLGWPDSDLAAALAAPTRPAARAVSTEDDVAQYVLPATRLAVKRRTHAPLVSMAIARPGGILGETAATAGITGLVMRTTLKGTASRSAHAIAIESERLGGSIAAAAGADLMSWSLTVPAEHVDAGFDLLADVALHPTFPDRDVERERAMVVADLGRLRDDMYRYPLRLVLKAAFGDHPYGRGPDEVERAIQDFTAGDLRRWHAGALSGARVFVVGDVDPDRVLDLVAARFEPPPDGADGEPPKPIWPDGLRSEAVRRDKAQTALALAFPGPARDHPDRIPLEVLSSAVSGLGNRLFEELRSRRSLAYSVTAYPLSRRHGGAFVGYIATSADRAGEAREALLDELGRLRDEPPSEEELERARRYAVGTHQIRTQTNASQLNDLVGALLLGDGLAEIREYEARVRAVSRDDVLAAARRWFDPDRIAEGVVHGSPAASPAG